MRLTIVFLASLFMIPTSLLGQESGSAIATTQGFIPGDQLSVRLFDFPDTGSTPLVVVVSENGSIHLPYAGSIPVMGMSPSSVEASIASALQNKGIVKEPNVSVGVVSAANYLVQVIGQVNNPRALPVYAPVSVSYVLGQVGGVQGLASHHITIIHHSDEAPTSLDYDPQTPNTNTLNTLVKPGDIVNVSHIGLFFAVGEVGKPGVYPLSGGLTVGNGATGLGFVEGMTLLKALAQVGGVTPIAARSKTRILRTVDGKREEIMIDIVKLERGEIADPILHPEDILYVPSSYIRSQTNNLFQTLLSGLYTVPVIKSF